MIFLKKISDKIKVSFTWKGNSKNVSPQKNGYFQLQQEKNGTVNVFNIENITVSQIKNLTNIDTTQDDKTILTSVGKRFMTEQIVRQQNVSSTVEKSALDNIVDPNNLDKDWFLKWMSTAEEISREKLQEILAKILSGEIQRPGSFSYKTLEVIKYLSREDLEKLQKFIAFSSEDGFFCLGGASKSKVMEKYGLSFTDYVKLSDLGLFNQSSSLSISLDIKDGVPAIINIGKEEFIISLEDGARDLDIGCVAFSVAGKELYPLLLDDVRSEKIEVYKEDFIKYIEGKGFKIQRRNGGSHNL